MTSVRTEGMKMMAVLVVGGETATSSSGRSIYKNGTTGCVWVAENRVGRLETSLDHF